MNSDGNFTIILKVAGTPGASVVDLDTAAAAAGVDLGELINPGGKVTVVGCGVAKAGIPFLKWLQRLVGGAKLIAFVCDLIYAVPTRDWRDNGKFKIKYEGRRIVTDENGNRRVTSCGPRLSAKDPYDEDHLGHDEDGNCKGVPVTKNGHVREVPETPEHARE